MSVTSLSRSRSRSRSISPTVVQESPLENPALTDSDTESGSVSILDSCRANLASGHVNVAATDGSASQSPANSPVLPIVVPTAVKSPPPQIPARSAFGLSSTACNAYSWAINRIAGNPPDPHTAFPFLGPNSMPGHTTVIGNPMHAHPHARSTSLSVQVQLMSTICGGPFSQNHFHQKRLFLAFMENMSSGSTPTTRICQIGQSRTVSAVVAHSLISNGWKIQM